MDTMTDNGQWHAPGPELGSLSDREMELLRLLATGATNREIARDLYISVNTVKVHLRNIYAKLNVASRTEATMVAVRAGWITVARPADEEEEIREQALPPAQPATASLPPVERWPRVSMGRRVGFVLASLVVLVALFLPQVLQGSGNGEQLDPIGAVLPSALDVTPSNRWQTRAQMPTPRAGLAVVSLDGLLYAMGGASSEGVTGRVEVYDPQTDTWVRRGSKPTPVGFVQAVALDGKIYVPGGFDAEQQAHDVLEVYDPAADAWEARASLPEALGAYGLAALDGRLYLFGGRGSRDYVDSAYRYDPAADRWESIASLSGPRAFVEAAVLEDRIYVVGGYDGTVELSTCEAYDPATETMEPCAPLTRPRGGLALVAVREYLYAVGGGMESYLAFSERYDPRLNAWTRVETPVTGQWLSPGAAFVSPHLYAIGGWKGAFLSANEAYQALYQFILP